MRQAQIVHFSDVHFGSSHNFNPKAGPDGAKMPQDGVVPFSNLFSRDLDFGSEKVPTLVAFTGDITTKHESDGFQEGVVFFEHLKTTSICKKIQDIAAFAAVPGNHDIDFFEDAQDERWGRWAKFYNQVFCKNVDPQDPLEFVELIDRSKSDGICVLTLNSEIHVKRGSADEFRGQIDDRQLNKIVELLEQHKASLDGSIKIAMIHKHPVLIPELVEGNRNYDAVVQSGNLINLLQKHGFHLILHGHKHWPTCFTIDHNNAYDSGQNKRPILVVSAGTLGSREFRPGVGSDDNCYNRIFITWNPASDEARIKVDTRVLMKIDESKQPLPTSAQWYWKTANVDDRSFYGSERNRKPINATYSRPEDRDVSWDGARSNEYARLRGNLPVVEVRPSLAPQQKYEAVFWIVGHDGDQTRDVPRRVTWSAGSKFPVVQTQAASDSSFAGRLTYFGAMLIQAVLEFEDGKAEFAYVYARLPDENVAWAMDT